MPLLAVKTNVSIKDASKLLNLLTDAVVNATGKPKDRICVLLDGDKTMAFAGSTEPCAMISFGEWLGCRASFQRSLFAPLLPHPSHSFPNLFLLFWIPFLSFSFSLSALHSMLDINWAFPHTRIFFGESIGGIEGKQKDMTKVVMTILREQIGVSPERSLMFFHDLDKKNVGYNLSTVGWLSSTEDFIDM